MILLDLIEEFGKIIIQEVSQVLIFIGILLYFQSLGVAIESWKQGSRVKDKQEPELVIDTTNLRLYNNDWKLIPNTNRTFNINIEGFLDDYKTDFFKDMFNALMEIQRIYAIK